MKLFSWKKEKHDGMLCGGLSWEEWGLPFSIRPIFGKFDSLPLHQNGAVEFAKVKSKGWCLEVWLNLFCFYLFVEFNRWHI